MSDLITELWAGRLRWDLLQPFAQQPSAQQPSAQPPSAQQPVAQMPYAQLPSAQLPFAQQPSGQQPFAQPPLGQPPETARGAAAVAEVGRLVGPLDPDAVDEAGTLPPDFLDELRRSDLLRLQLPQAHGGLGLSDWETFQTVVHTMRLCLPAGYVLATHNGIGLPSLLPALPPGELHDLILARLREGAISGWADTEPAGAANTLPVTTATPTGAGWKLNGRKVYISNGTVADELVVSALQPDGEAGLFVVGTGTPGFTAGPAPRLLGMRGISLGAFSFNDVWVPSVRHVPHEGTWRDTPLLEPVSARGRTYIVVAASLALAESALRMQREAATRRFVDGRPLIGYGAIGDLIARSVADTAAIRAMALWCLAGDEEANLTDRYLDRKATKNAASLACWRVVDRTVSLFAAEGLETARSKRARGVAAWPVEQLLRDARVLRVAGGVDFALDVWAAESALAEATGAGPRGLVGDAAALTSGHLAQLRLVARHAGRLAGALRAVSDVEDQHRLGTLGRIMGELFAMVVTLAGAPAAADVYCAEASHRLAGLWQALESADRSAYARMAADFVAGGGGETVSGR